jgi:hypothetical protein
VQWQGGAGLQRLGRKGDAGCGVEAQGGAGLHGRGARLRAGARLNRREALRGLWCGGARAAPALAWRRKGGVGLQR